MIRKRLWASFGVVAVVVAALALLSLLPAGASASPGSIDPSFGVNGAAMIDLGSGDTRVLETALQPDGKVVAACTLTASADPLHPSYWLVRLTQDGQSDTTFGLGGKILIDWADAQMKPIWPIREAPLMIQPGTGRIIVFFQDLQAGLGQGYRLAAYTTGGALDTSFGDEGFLTPSAPSGGQTLDTRSFSMAGDGSLVAAGALTGNRGDVALYRFTPGGQLDTSFATGGRFIADLAHLSADCATAAVVDHLGRVVVTGDVESSHFLLRLLADGSLDPAFGAQGVLVPAPDNIMLLQELPDGKLLADQQLAGLFLKRLNADGSVDQTYNTVISALPKSGTAQWTSLADGSIVVTGTVDSGYPTFSDFAVWRYTPDGLSDITFADGGRQVIDFGAADDSATCAVRPTGEILIAGATGSTSAGLTRGLAAAAPSKGIIAQLVGGVRTGLSTRLTKAPTPASVMLRLRNSRAIWKTSAILKSGTTPLSAMRLTLLRSRNGRTWSKQANATTGRIGNASTTVKLTRKGTYWFRWSFAGTASFRKASSALTKVIVK
jgi:uncharacterized delta-60 repeat protein